LFEHPWIKQHLEDLRARELDENETKI
jgi:hypothetical protein